MNTDPLDIIEGINGIADILETARQAMLARDWSPVAAEQAALIIYQVNSFQGAGR